jgi:two-component system, sensor histidine kinase and response regulator
MEKRMLNPNFDENEKNARILMVDDNAQNIQVLGNILKERGYKISVSMNGNEALNFVNKTIPDLILLDIMMPEMDGFEVCRRLKENESTRDIPVIFLTAKTESDDIVKGFEVGGIDYVTKPFKKEELLVRVRTHLKLKRTEHELRNTASELRELVSMKNRLFSIIGHDLRGPIGSFMMILDTVIDEDTDLSIDRIKDYLRKMKVAAKNSYQLLDNLLNWARSQQKLIKFQPVNSKIINLVEQNIQVLDGIAKNKGITLFHEVDPNFIVYIDENTISTAIRNLISNSLKFTEKEGRITVSGKTTEGFVQISIQDTGIGMAEENLKKLFRQDQIFSTWGTEGEKGTGLGLLLCKDFVEGNGGKIWVESEIGKGSTFHFTVPLKEDIR